MPAEILIVAINARYSHCSHAARVLLANLGDLQSRAAILESDLDAYPLQIVAQIIAAQPRLVGFSVYLWNRRAVRDILELLRQIAPSTRAILGGPEIVPGCVDDWRGLADALVCGEGEWAFRDWCCQQLDDGSPLSVNVSPEWIEVRSPPPLEALAPADAFYTAEDLRHRVTYVEASRGCPWHCLYCTSCGTGLRRHPLAPLLASFQRLFDRGLRQFRFLDRTFNADETHACAILDFFLPLCREGINLHLELTPAAFGQPLRKRLAAFPPGALHLEAGLQTLNETVARAIGRRESRAEALAALGFLRHETQAAIHADLIFGLPGEDEGSFARGFDQLVRLDLPEIQVNRLKGLPGTPLLKLPALAGAFSRQPPYEALRTDCLTFDDLTRLQRFAMAWDRLHNRGRFRHTLPLLWRDGAASPYARIRELAETAERRHGRVHALGLHDWARLLAQQLLALRPADGDAIDAALKRDGLEQAMRRNPCDMPGSTPPARTRGTTVSTAPPGTATTARSTMPTRSSLSAS